MKLLLLIVLLFFAVGVMMALLTRLTRIQQRLANLQSDLTRNDDEMARHRREIARLQALEDARTDEGEIKS